jgi:hypothetical protein
MFVALEKVETPILLHRNCFVRNKQHEDPINLNENEKSGQGKKLISRNCRKHKQTNNK